MKLHIGCGEKFLEGYIHIDVTGYPHVNIITPAHMLNMLTDNCVDEIYACHIFEHYGRHEHINALKEWYRVLKTNGIVRISVPDFDAVVEHYNEHKDLNLLVGLLYGRQNYEFNFHHYVFNYKTLSEALSVTGFTDIQRYDWRDFLPKGFDDFSRSYLPHMDFDNGKLMSLNLVAKKV